MAFGGIGSALKSAGGLFGLQGTTDEEQRLRRQLERRASGSLSNARLAGQQRENAAMSRTLAASNTGAGNPALAQRQAADFLEGANARSQQQEAQQAAQEQLQAAQQLDALDQRKRQQAQQGLGNLFSVGGQVGGFLAGQGGGDDGGGQGGDGASLPGGQLMQSDGVGGIASAVTGGGGGGGSGLGTIGSLAGTAAGGPLGGMAGGAIGNAIGGGGGEGGGLGETLGMVDSAMGSLDEEQASMQERKQQDLSLLGATQPKGLGAAAAANPGSGRSMRQMRESRAQAQAEKDALRSEMGLAPEPLSDDELLQGWMEGRF